MAKMNFKDALNKSLQATKKYVDDAIQENGLMDFPGTRNAGNMIVQATDLKAGGWYKMPDKIEDKNLPNAIFVQKMGADGYNRNWTIFENGDVPDRSAIFYVAANNDNNTILMRYGAVATKINIDWIADKRTIELVNNIYEFEPTNDYNFASKKYVDDRTTEETEEETFNKLLEEGLILGSVELEDGSMLTDNDGNPIIF